MSVCELIRADTDEHLWSATYDRELQDVLALQSDVTQGIARHIEVAVNGDATALTRRPAHGGARGLRGLPEGPFCAAQEQPGRARGGTSTLPGRDRC